MEETVASTQEINATSIEISKVVQTVSLKTQKGSEKADEISTGADALKDAAVKSSEQAYSVYKQNQEKLVSSIEHSNGVGSISEHVIKDYNTLVDTGEQYSSDANTSKAEIFYDNTFISLPK